MRAHNDCFSSLEQHKFHLYLVKLDENFGLCLLRVEAMGFCCLFACKEIQPFGEIESHDLAIMAIEQRRVEKLLEGELEVMLSSASRYPIHANNQFLTKILLLFIVS